MRQECSPLCEVRVQRVIAFGGFPLSVGLHRGHDDAQQRDGDIGAP